jgi:hypothetical protein
MFAFTAFENDIKMIFQIFTFCFIRVFLVKIFLGFLREEFG